MDYMVVNPGKPRHQLTPNLTWRVASGFGGCKKAEGGCWASFKSVFVYVSERKEKIRAEGDNNYAIK